MKSVKIKMNENNKWLEFELNWIGVEFKQQSYNEIYILWQIQTI